MTVLYIQNRGNEFFSQIAMNASSYEEMLDELNRILVNESVDINECGFIFHGWDIEDFFTNGGDMNIYSGFIEDVATLDFERPNEIRVYRKYEV